MLTPTTPAERHRYLTILLGTEPYRRGIRIAYDARTQKWSVRDLKEKYTPLTTAYYPVIRAWVRGYVYRKQYHHDPR